MSEGDMKNYVKIINKEKPKIIEAYVQSIYEFARFIRNNDLEVFSPRGIITSAGTLYPEMKELIEEVFHTKVYNRYGSREVGDMACSCEKDEGLHLNIFNQYVEILNDKLELCKPGEIGKVYVTTLNNYSMPLIRYDIGDMAIPAKNEQCSCGRGLPLIEKVVGRTGSMIKTKKGVFINVVFSKEVEVREPEAFVGIDLNENNVTLSLPNGEFVQINTHEREVRTGYFVKRRRIQRKLRTGKRRKELLEKYGRRERNRISDLYHKLANKIVEIAEKYGGIALEDLNKIRNSIRYTAEVNGRLHRWSFRKLQSIIEYKAKLKGVKVVFVNSAYTSSLCPICGEKLSPKGHRVLECLKCGFEADRDVVGSWNIRLRALKMWGVSVPPESQPMRTGGWKVICYADIRMFQK